MKPKMGVTNKVCLACGKAKYVITDMCESRIVNNEGERVVYNVALVCPRCRDTRSERLA